MTVKELIDELQYEVKMGRSDWDVLPYDFEKEQEYKLVEVAGAAGLVIHLTFNESTDDWE